MVCCYQVWKNQSHNIFNTKILIFQSSIDNLWTYLNVCTVSIDWLAIHFEKSSMFGKDADAATIRIAFPLRNVLNLETIASSVGPRFLSPTKCISSINTKRTAFAMSECSFHFRVIESHFSGVVTIMWYGEMTFKSSISVVSPVTKATFKLSGLNFWSHFWNISLHKAFVGATTKITWIRLKITNRNKLLWLTKKDKKKWKCLTALTVYNFECHSTVLSHFHSHQ